MSLSYPLTPPATPGFSSIQWIDQGNVGMTVSPFTGETQTYRWPRQSWAAQVTLPAIKAADVGSWIAFFLALNGAEGTFYFGDSVRKTSLGTLSGAPVVGGGAVANSSVLPFTGGGGAAALGDWIQVGTGTSMRLHRIIQVNAGNWDVFPRLRSAYASGTAIAYTNTKGVFRLTARVPWMFDPAKIAAGVSFSVMEAL